MHSAEPIDPSHSFDDDFSVQDDDFVYAEDSVSDCVSTGLEAEALLKRYGGDLYLPSYNKAPGEFASNTPSDSARFFRTRTSDEAGIELPLGFSREYDNISSSREFNGMVGSISKGFRFQKETAEKYFITEKASLELMALGDSLAESFPLKARAFREEDSRWCRMSDSSRSISRLSVYSTALADLLVRADELDIKPEDHVTIQSLLLAISQLTFTQAARATVFAFRQRRKLAFESLGLRKQATSFNVEAIPCKGPYLFAGQLLDTVDLEISMHKRASDLAYKLKPLLSTKTAPSFASPFRGGTAYRSRGRARFPRASRAVFRSAYRSRSRGAAGLSRGRGFAGRSGPANRRPSSL